MNWPISSFCSVDTDNLEEQSSTLVELKETMKKMKNNKTPGEDYLNIELFKYSTKLFLFRFLSFFNLIWNGWSKSIVIPIHKKEVETI